MSHYQLEIILPPVPDISAAVTEIMAPFYEGASNDDDHDRRHAFWDFWNIGGRWSGRKLLVQLGQERVDAFGAALNAAGITVSGFQFGKPTLNPASQLLRVNQMWNEAFPESPVKECPLFDSYKGNYGDVMLLQDVPPGLTCDHIIIAGPNWKDEKLEAQYMVRDSIWNGVTHQETAWSGRLVDAVTDWVKRLENYKPDWAETRRPAPDWQVVTVDYHS